MELPGILRQRFREIEKLPQTGNESTHAWIVASPDVVGLKVLKLTSNDRALRADVIAKLNNLDARASHLLVPEEYGVVESWYYQLSDYFRLGNLQPYLFEISDSVRETLVQNMHSALIALHQNLLKIPSVAHCDIKPSNILASNNAADNWQFYLADFDAAVAVESQSVGANTLRHTPRYAAPEVIRTGIAYPASDYWSLGMVIMESLLGRHPTSKIEQSQVSHTLALGWKPPFRAIEGTRWRALCGGLLENHPGRRWGASEVQRWLDQDPAIISNGLQQIGEHACETPFIVAGEQVVSANGLAAAVLRHWSVDSLNDPDLAEWLRNELQRGDSANLLENLQSDETLDEDLRLLRFCFSLDDELQPSWHENELTENSLAAVAKAASAGDKDKLEWLQSLLDGRCFGFFSRCGNQQIEALGQRFTDGWTQYQNAWDTVIRHGAPDELRPAEDVALPTITGIVFSGEQRTELRSEATRFFDPATLLIREPWFLHFGSDFATLSDAELAVLRELDEFSLLPDVNVGALDQLGRIDHDQLQNSVIVLRSQSRLLGNLVVNPGEAISVLRPGDTFNAPQPATLADQIRVWLARPWFGNRRNAAENDDDEAAIDEIDMSVRLVHLVAAQQMQAFPADFEAYLLQVSWRTPEDLRVRIRASYPGLIFRQARLVTPVLPDSGSMLLLVTSDIVIRMKGRRGWFRPRVRTRPVVVRFRPNLTFSPPSREILPVDHSMTRYRGKQIAYKPGMIVDRIKMMTVSPKMLAQVIGKMRGAKKISRLSKMHRPKRADRKQQKLFTHYIRQFYSARTE